MSDSKISLGGLWSDSMPSSTETTTTEATASETTSTETTATSDTTATTTTETTPEVTSTETTTTTETTPTFDFSKIAGGRFKSAEEIEATLTQLETEKASFKPKEYNPIAEKLNEFLSVEDGRKPEDFFRIVNRDFTSLPSLEAVKEDMKINNKDGLSEDEIEFLIRKQYGEIKKPKHPGELASDEEIEEYNDRLAEISEEQRLREIKLKRDGEAAKERLESLKGKYKVEQKQPVDNTALREQAEADAKLIAEQMRNQKVIEDDYILDSKDGKGLKFKYEYSSEDIDYVAEIAKGRNPLEKYFSNGNVDIEAFKRDMSYLNSRAKREAALVQQAYNAGKEAVIKERSNIDLSQASSKDPVSKSGSISLSGLF